MKEITFVLPVFNEEAVIRVFHTTLAKVADGLSRFNFSFIYVDDGSTDKSLSILLEIQKEDPRVSVLEFSRNFGHQRAITAGIDYATGDAIIVMDTDLQDPPHVVPELIDVWEEGYDVVYAQRRERHESFFKRFSAKVFYRLFNFFFDVRIPEDAGDFRLLSRRAVDELKKFGEHARFMRGLATLIGFKQKGVLFDRDARYAGETKYPLHKMIKFSLDGLFSFSTAPLSVISRVGFFVSFLSFVGIVYALFMYVAFPSITVPGWTFIVIAMLFIGGVQMLMLGIIGGYLGRVYDDVRERPLYILSKIHHGQHRETSSTST